MERNQTIFKRGRKIKSRAKQRKTFTFQKIILSFLFVGTGLFAFNNNLANTNINKEINKTNKVKAKQNKIIEKYISQCEMDNEKACDNLFFEYLKEKQYDKAAETGWQNFYKGYFNTLPYMADLITTNKTKYKNCRFGLLLLEGAIKARKCVAFKILSQWYKEGRCTHKPNLKKSQKYYNMYLKCKEKKSKKH